MKRHFFVLLTAFFLAGPVIAAEADVNAEAKVEAKSEGGFFSNAWTSVKGFFGAGDEEAPAAEPEKEEPGLVDKAADSTKAGIDWTKDKAKKSAEWTKETAVNVKDDAVGGAKAVGNVVGEGAAKAGNAIKGALSSDTEVEVEAEASAESN